MVKRITSLVTAVVFALALQAAFAGSGIAAEKSSGNDKPYNGITFFDIGAAAAAPAEAPDAGVPAAKPFNGITFFDTGTPPAPVAAAAPSSADTKPYNGITQF